MLLLFTASRTWDDAGYIFHVLDDLLCEHGQLTVVYGAGRGGDVICRRWVQRRIAQGARVRADPHPVDHRLDGPWPAAGPRRNQRMVRRVAKAITRHPEVPAECHGFVRDNSPGTTGCMTKARRAGIHTVPHEWDKRHQRRAGPSHATTHPREGT